MSIVPHLGAKLGVVERDVTLLGLGRFSVSTTGPTFSGFVCYMSYQGGCHDGYTRGTCTDSRGLTRTRFFPTFETYRLESSKSNGGSVETTDVKVVLIESEAFLSFDDGNRRNHGTGRRVRVGTDGWDLWDDYRIQEVRGSGRVVGSDRQYHSPFRRSVFGTFIVEGMHNVVVFAGKSGPRK